MDWKNLTQSEQLNEIVENSFKKPVLIFKHSTRCGISSIVYSKFKKKTVDYLDKIDFYYLDLLKYRDISNEIALRFNINHKSPQILLINKGEVVLHNSHYEIIMKSIKGIEAII